VSNQEKFGVKSLIHGCNYRDILLRDNFECACSFSEDLKMLGRRNSHEVGDIYLKQRALGEAFEHLPVSVAQLKLDGTLLSANQQMCVTIGQPARNLLEKSLEEFFLPEESWPACKDGLNKLIAGEVPHYSANMSAVRTAGEQVWVNMVFSLLRDDVTNKPRSLTAVAKDITFLKRAEQELRDAEVVRNELSRKMMNAQEASRTGIARELHDDIGQSLAVLKIQMLRAGQPVSGSPEMLHASLKDLAVKLETIINKVSRLSHDLHSSELELLGLAVAVKGHCRECSKQLGIPIDCSCDHLQEKLDGMIALAFLRVLQEATHNAVKHSRATGMTVRLTCSDHELSLEISDDGVGFDLETARLAAGLGLISMRERIHLVGGKYEIQSSPGHGTRITARAPIAKRTF
jgi:PAS domain S-box-containing protein